MANFGKEISKLKMVIYLKDKSQLTFYSLEEEDKKGVETSIRGMTRRLLDKRYLNKYTTAVFYNKNTDSLVAKFINGSRVRI